MTSMAVLSAPTAAISWSSTNDAASTPSPGWANSGLAGGEEVEPPGAHEQDVAARTSVPCASAQASSSADVIA